MKKFILVLFCALTGPLSAWTNWHDCDITDSRILEACSVYEFARKFDRKKTPLPFQIRTFYGVKTWVQAARVFGVLDPITASSDYARINAWNDKLCPLIDGGLK